MRLTPHPVRSTPARRPVTRRPVRSADPHRVAAPRRVHVACCGTGRPPADQPPTPQVRPEPRRPPRSATRALLVVELALLAVIGSGSVAAAESAQVLALAGSVEEVLSNLRNWVMGILASLATVFLSFGSVRYLMAGGDPGEIEKAKTAFKAAGIGYGMCALAPLVVTVLAGIVGA